MRALLVLGLAAVAGLPMVMAEQSADENQPDYEYWEEDLVEIPECPHRDLCVSPAVLTGLVCCSVLAVAVAAVISAAVVIKTVPSQAVRAKVISPYTLVRACYTPMRTERWINICICREVDVAVGHRDLAVCVDLSGSTR